MTEQRAVYRSLKAMGLRRRYKTRGGRGGRFIYVASSSNLFFDWDGEAKSIDGSLVLVEAELSAPNAIHIQGHLSRLAIMVAFKEQISTCSEFRAMIDHSIDREELEDIRHMLLEASDLSFVEKTELSNHPEKVYRAAPELRK